METNPLICSVNLWTGFYMVGTFVMKELQGNFNGKLLTEKKFARRKIV